MMRFTWQIHSYLCMQVLSYTLACEFVFPLWETNSHSSDLSFCLTEQVWGWQTHFQQPLNAALPFHIRQGVEGIKADLSAEMMKTFHCQFQAQPCEQYRVVKTTTKVRLVCANLLFETPEPHPSCFKNGSFQLTVHTVTGSRHDKYFPACR